MIAFIDDHRGVYGGEPICRVLPIASSAYLAHVVRRADPTMLSARVRRDGARRRLDCGSSSITAIESAQYDSINYTERLADAGIELSMGSVDDSYDDALAKTINDFIRPRAWALMAIQGAVRASVVKTSP